MNKKILLAVIFMMTFLFSGVAAAAEVQIANRAGFELFEVHFAPSNTGKWGADVLNMNVILKDETVTVRWDDKGFQGPWDIMVLDENESKFYWSKLSLNGVSRVILKPEGNADFE